MLYTGNVTNSAMNATCASINEIPVSVGNSFDPGFTKQLEYLFYDKTYYSGKAFWIKNKETGTSQCTVVLVTANSISLTTRPCTNANPVLCSNSAPRTTSSAATKDSKYAISVNGFTAYRDAISFRFLQIPYANTPQRFAQSTIYTGGTAGTSSVCPAPGNSATEDCLILNVYSPIVAPGTNIIKPKPIMVFFHGGGFTTGSGQDPTFDGASLASRGDVVVVTPNFRLGTLGFLPVGNQATGNYAVGDVITALKWVQANAASFGGDKTKVTIFGQSSGAQMVTTLLSTPAATGLYSRAITQSSRPADRQNLRQTIAAAEAGGAKTTISSLGCSTASDVLSCLRGKTTAQILAGTAFNVPVVDGKLVTQPNVDVAQLRGGYVNKVPVIMGFMRDEQASLGYAPPTSQTSLDAALSAGGISSGNRTTIENNKTLFPVPSGSNGIQNLTVTVETDTQSISRCGQESTYYSAAQKGVFSSLYTYTQDQRSYQISGYDPNNICLSTSSATSGYYLCHSGDLYPTFNTAGYVAQYPVRDADDIAHSALMMDLWTSFADSGNPNPPAAYLTQRGYTTTASRLNSAGGWTPTTSSSMNILSLGPHPAMKSLSIRGSQCSALGMPLNYISQGK
jgi:carboxylesterase type B